MVSVISPLSFVLALMVPTQTGFRGKGSLLFDFMLVHNADFTFTSAHTHSGSYQRQWEAEEASTSCSSSTINHYMET